MYNHPGNSDHGVIRTIDYTVYTKKFCVARHIVSLCNFELSLATFFFETNVLAAFQQPSSVTYKKLVRVTYMYMYNSNRKEGGEGAEKDQGRGAGKTNNTFYKFNFTLLKFSFYTFLCGHPIWSHMTESYAAPNFPRSRFKKFFCLRAVVQIT